MISRIISIILLISAVFLLVTIIDFAPQAFEVGGYIQRAMVHLGTILGTLNATIAIFKLLED